MSHTSAERSPAETVHRRTLPNGLRVCVVERPTLPMVAVNLAYAVGSRDERDGLRGFAHLFEHLMFQGSEHTEAGEFSALLTRYGGSPNATTNFDVTHYFETVPSNALELALWLEADRLGGMLSALDQAVLDNEREVVKNERRERMDNQPYGTAYELMLDKLYPDQHGYHLLPIGLMADIDAATLEDVRAFFRTHYAPNNAALALIGDLSADEGFALAERYFGHLQAIEVPEHPPVPLERGTAQVRIEFDDKMPAPAIMGVFRTPNADHPDFAALQVGAMILGGTESSRLPRRFVREEQLAQQVEVGVQRLHGEAGFTAFSAFLMNDVVPAAFEPLMWQEFARLAAEAPSEDEMARARAGLERSLWERTSTLEGMADLISEHEAFHPGEDAVECLLAEVSTPTADDVRRAVATWFVPENSVVVTYQAMTEADWAAEAAQDLENSEAAR